MLAATATRSPAARTTTGGAYGTGGNYFWSPNPDTVAAGSVVTFSMGSVPHSVHFIAVPTGAVTPDSVPLMGNGTATRTLTTPGTYTIECFNHMFMGTIVVNDRTATDGLRRRARRGAIDLSTGPGQSFRPACRERGRARQPAFARAWTCCLARVSTRANWSSSTGLST